jgi:4-hydroxyphenylpyruvate dioxygenase-like putative hemolysin
LTKEFAVSKSAISETARFVRLRNGDVYRRTEMLEQAKGSVLIGDDEARAYFEKAGANLKALGLDGKAPAKKAEKAPAKKAEPAKKDEAPKAVVADSEDDLDEMLKDLD